MGRQCMHKMLYMAIMTRVGRARADSVAFFARARTKALIRSGALCTRFCALLGASSTLHNTYSIGSGRRGKEIRVRKKERNPDLPPKQKKDALDALENQGVEPCTSRTS
jgi:hypothetical protein